MKKVTTVASYEVDFVTINDNELHIFKTVAGKYYYTINDVRTTNKLFKTQSSAYIAGEQDIEEEFNLIR